MVGLSTAVAMGNLEDLRTVAKHGPALFADQAHLILLSQMSAAENTIHRGRLFLSLMLPIDISRHTVMYLHDSVLHYRPSIVN